MVRSVKMQFGLIVAYCLRYSAEVKLDRSLTYGKHNNKLQLKLATNINLILKDSIKSITLGHTFYIG